VQQTILVIDDSEDVHDLLEVRLKPEMVKLDHAGDGERGIDRAKEGRPDLILLDIEMPNLTGFEVCQRLKDDPATSTIPVIFLTGAGDVHDKVQGFDLGAVDYITKPFQPAELRARVRAALRMKRYHDLLSTRAHVDGLTGLWNRGYFTQRIGVEIAAFGRYGRTVSLVLFDIDHFKKINDSYGHPFGDLVLQRVGDVTSTLLRVTDAPCRYGGEEFVLLLTETPLDGALRVAERIQEDIRGLQLTQRGKPVKVTASFGVSSTALFSNPREATPAALIELTDQALYAAKHNGRDRIVIASQPADRVEHKTVRPMAPSSAPSISPT
jgi:two-component system cell cycle response regulator